MILAKKVFPTAAEMGVWALFQTVISSSSTIKISLLRNPMIKFLGGIKTDTEKNIIQSTVLITNVIFSALVFVFILLFGKMFCNWLGSPQLLPLCYWGLVLVLLQIPLDHCEILLQAHFKFRHIFFGYCIKQGFFLLGIVILHFILKSHITLVTLVQIQIVAMFATLVLFAVAASQYFQKGWQMNRLVAREMFHYAKYTFGSNLFTMIARSSDSFLTANRTLSDAVIGYYNIVGRMTNMIDVPSLAVSDVLFPKNVIDMASEGKKLVRYNFERMIGGILSFILPVSLVMFLFPGFIIRTLASEKYLPAIPILQVTMVFSCIRPFFYLFGATMDAIGKPNLNFWVAVFYMPFHLFCISEGLHLFGWIGSLYATVTSSTICCMVLFFILNKTIGITLKGIIGYILITYKDLYNYISVIFKKNTPAEIVS